MVFGKQPAAFTLCFNEIIEGKVEEKEEVSSMTELAFFFQIFPTVEGFGSLRGKGNESFQLSSEIPPYYIQKGRMNTSKIPLSKYPQKETDDIVYHHSPISLTTIVA